MNADPMNAEPTTADPMNAEPTTAVEHGPTETPEQTRNPEMTMTTAPARPAAPPVHRRAERKVGHRVSGTLLRSAVWFAVPWVAIVVGTPFAVERWDGELSSLTYASDGGPGRWVAFAVGVIATSAILTIHVAAGGTRRALAAGVVRGAVPGAAVFGLLAATVMLGEQRLYGALGRPWTGAGPYAVDTAPGFATTALGETLVVVTYVLVGAAMAAAYRRSGPWLGTALIVPLLVPAAVAELATRTGLFAQSLHDVAEPAPPVAAVVTVVGGLAAAALAAVVLDRLLRSTPVRPAP
jgi:hypothetical protein